MKILIGVDASAHSKAAVEFVRRMTWPAGTQVIVLSIAEVVMPIYAGMPLTAVVPIEAQEDFAAIHRDIATAAEQALRSDSLVTESRVLRGDPRTGLVETAQREHVDLIVVGSHGRTGIAKLVMGSVASYVVAHAACNVLVVKTDRHRIC